MSELRVGVLGATSFVGQRLLPRLIGQGCRVTAWSRKNQTGNDSGVAWRQLSSGIDHPVFPPTPLWVCVMPVWALPDYFVFLEAQGAQRIVAVSSTSRFTKENSAEEREQELAGRLADAEVQLREWAEKRDMAWVILRPTLIYGLGQDKNIAEIARFIKKFGFFPIFGQARGARQPIHVDDVADACVAALLKTRIANQAYNLAGGETILYRDMVRRIFTAMGRPARLLPVPLLLFRLALAMARLLPRYRHWTPAMAERMNQDMTFDKEDAERDLAFKPRSFVLTKTDLSS